MSDYIPDELLIEILARLPVASLLRFKSVCKSWYFLIASPSFITRHLKQSITSTERNGSKLLVRVYEHGPKYEERYLLLNDDDKFGDEYSEMNFPFKLQCGYFRIVGTCNGLICIADDYFNNRPHIIIWNPSTRTSATLPGASLPKCPHMFVFGFGVHPITNEYKVVRIKYETGAMGHPYMLPPSAEIYSRGTRSWRGISSAVPPYCIVDYMWSQAFVGGVVHWLAYYHLEEGPAHNLIILFNMTSESFSEFKLPPTLADQPPLSLSIMPFRQSLAVLYSEQRDGGGFCFWGMKEYGAVESWIKLFNFNLLGTPNKTIGFRKNGEVLLAVKNFLVSYAPETQTFVTTGITGTSRAFYIDPFVETLCLV